MGSPITFSGFNNIDFGVVLNAIMQQERAPLAAVESQKSTLQAQNSAFTTFATKLAALESAVSALGDTDSLSMVAATTSDDRAVGVSSGIGTVSGRYEVVVSSLARAQVTMSETTYDSIDTVIATSGILTLAQFSQPPIEIPITGAKTLKDLADAINQAPNSPVTASVVQVAPGQYRLVLTGRVTGAANGFTVSVSGFSGGQGLSFIDTDGDGTSGDDAADNVQAAADASLTVNEIPITSASNILSDVIPGATITLKQADPTNTIAIDVEQDHSDIIEKVKAFATAYNDVLAFIGEQTNAAAAGRANIGRDPMVRQFRDSLRAAMMGAEAGGTLTRLAEVGIGFDRNGKVTINEDRLKNALETSVADVQLLFAGADGNSGRFGAIKALISSYTTAGGLLANVRDRIDEQVARLNARLTVMEEQLAIRRAALQQEFIAADRAMAQLTSQASSLVQLSGQYRLF
jgi:flagellar hook-associated protein 2